MAPAEMEEFDKERLLDKMISMLEPEGYEVKIKELSEEKTKK